MIYISYIINKKSAEEVVKLLHNIMNKYSNLSFLISSALLYIYCNDSSINNDDNQIKMQLKDQMKTEVKTIEQDVLLTIHSSYFFYILIKHIKLLKPLKN